jgi:hypothetical protein
MTRREGKIGFPICGEKERPRRFPRSVGGNAPSVYLARIQKSAEIEPARMDEILRFHLIAPDAIRADDFEARSRAMLDRIEKAMGKPLLRDTSEA